MKWAGSKKHVIPALLSVFPSSWGAYYEPFVGGALVLSHLYSTGRVTRAVISDTNPDLINLYEVIRDRPDEIRAVMERLSFRNERRYYLSARRRFNRLRLSGGNFVERAALFLYLNRQGYNGLWRVNSRGLYNVPFGNYDTLNIPPWDAVMEFSRMLGSVEIRHMDFEAAVQDAAEGDLVYFDPPSVSSLNSSGSFSHMPGGFSAREQERLLRTVRQLTDRRVMVVVSSPWNEGLVDTYSEFHIMAVQPRGDNGNMAGGRKGMGELIITNYEPAPSALSEYLRPVPLPANSGAR